MRTYETKDYKKREEKQILNFELGVVTKVQILCIFKQLPSYYTFLILRFLTKKH